MGNEDKREKYLNQVRVLLDIAERETTPAGEAAAARAKAEHLMREYRIAEEETLASDPQAMAPEWRDFTLAVRGEFSQQYLNLFAYIADHVGIRARYVYVGQDLVAQAVGYDFDLRLADLLFTSARMVFAENLEPKVDPALGDQLNAYRLRRAGIPRNRVANLLWGASMGSDGAPAHGRVAKLYKAECEKRGESPALAGRGLNAATYRQAYADSFTSRLYRRLHDARSAVDKTSGAVTLAGRTERVDEAFYERYPEKRPVPVKREGAAACVACSKTKHASGKCPSHRPARLTVADRRRIDRQYYSREATAGASAGRAAADAVALDGSAPVRRIDDQTEEERETTRVVQGVLGR